MVISSPHIKSQTDSYPRLSGQFESRNRLTACAASLPWMSKKGPAALQKDAPWRTTAVRPVPKIHHAPLLRIPLTAYSDQAMTAMRRSDPIGDGMAVGAVVESAGPDCIVPGLSPPIKLLGVKVWPIDVNLKFMEPVERELKLLGKFMDSAVSLMNKSFIDQ